jgi:hypothetical protein
MSARGGVIRKETVPEPEWVKLPQPVREPVREPAKVPA